MTIEERLAALQKMTTGQLKQEWQTVFGEAPRSGNVPWLRKRLAWAIQARALGGLSEAVKQRIEELTPAALAWLPWGFRSFPRQNGPVSQVKRDGLTPGTILTRAYKGRTVEVLVREGGRFEYDGQFYRSLTAVATAITGSHWNGHHFFGLRRDRKAG